MPFFSLKLLRPDENSDRMKQEENHGTQEEHTTGEW
jgi:hypothetical protein